MESNLKDELTKFLTLKYKYQGKDLQKEIEKSAKKFKALQTKEDWLAIHRLLTGIKTPDAKNVRDGPEEKRPIRVILPKNQDPERSLRFLKASAYFPFQLEYECETAYPYDLNLMFQLAMATHYGSWNARYHLSESRSCFPLLDKKHPLVATRFAPINEEDFYFELPYPFPDTTFEQNYPVVEIDFDTEKDSFRTTEFFNYLLSIAKTGQRPEKEMFLVDPKHWQSKDKDKDSYAE
jgi:hypothetical protein